MLQAELRRIAIDSKRSARADSGAAQGRKRGAVPRVKILAKYNQCERRGVAGPVHCQCRAALKHARRRNATLKDAKGCVSAQAIGVDRERLIGCGANAERAIGASGPHPAFRRARLRFKADEFFCARMIVAPRPHKSGPPRDQFVL